MENKTSDSELVKILSILEIINDLETNLKGIQDPVAYNRIRSYINERCLSQPLPYRSPFIIEVK
jgi:hypothetical protein